jgi:hypothetical protein
MSKRVVFIAGLFGLAHSPLARWFSSAQQQWGDSVVGCDYDQPAVLLNYADADEILCVAHSFGVSRLFRDAHEIMALPARLRCFCIDGVQAWSNYREQIGVKPNALAQIGRPPFTASPNMLEVRSWRRHIGALEIFPLALSSPVIGSHVTDTEVANGMMALELLGSAFGGPAGETVADIIGGLVTHNSLVSAVMPVVMHRLGELMDEQA